MRPFSKASSYGTVDGEKSTIGDVSSGSSRGVRGALPMIVSWLLMVAVSRLQMIMRRVILEGKCCAPRLVELMICVPQAVAMVELMHRHD